MVQRWMVWTHQLGFDAQRVLPPTCLVVPLLRWLLDYHQLVRLRFSLGASHWQRVRASSVRWCNRAGPFAWSQNTPRGVTHATPMT